MAVDRTQLEMVRNKYGTEWDHDWQQLTERVRPYDFGAPRGWQVFRVSPYRRHRSEGV